MSSNENVDSKKVSAYMVHHVLHPQSKSVTKKNTKKTEKSKNKALVSMQQKATSSSNQRILSTANQFGETSKMSLKKKGQKSPNEETTISTKPCVAASKLPRTSPFEKHFQHKCLFVWMINPLCVDDFMRDHWEKQPLHIPNGHDSNEFSELVSTRVIDEILTSAHIEYTKNIDITFYSDGVKELHNLEGCARRHVVWDFYCSGCSVRMRNPQVFVPNIHKLVSELQEYFGCFVGCNAYLTPPHSQGFAPHYDDIEAFILQVEGKKRWRVYEPRSQDEVLPRFSSFDFTDSDLGEPIMEVVLNPGDLLYLPRGYIHQAVTEKDFHSLHITISAYQRNAWIDLLEKAVPKAMENAWKKDVRFREGLPLDYLNAAGLTRKHNHKNTRMMMKNKLKFLFRKLSDHMEIDSAVDQLASKFLYDALPPVLTEEEKSCSIFGDGFRMGENGRVLGATDENGQAIGTMKFEFNEETEIALLRKFVSRLVKEIVEVGPRKKKKVEYRLYYTTDNALESHAVDTSFSVVPKSFVRPIQYLFQSYPNYVSIRGLPHDNLEDKINFASDLWERGIIRSKDPVLKKME